MKISKKIFAVLLAVVLAFSVFAVCAAAEGEEEEPQAPFMAVTILTNKGAESYETDETVTVSVKVACNYNATALRFPIMYDASVLQAPVVLDVVCKNTCAELGTVNSNKSNAEHCFIPADYDADEWGCILVQWTASVKNGAVGCLNNPEGEIAFEFTLKTKSDAMGTGTIFIPDTSDLFYNQAIADPTDATSIYYVNDIASVLTFEPANVVMAGGEAALIPNAAFDSKAVIDEENGWVYGLGLGLYGASDFEPYVIPSNDNAEMEIEFTEAGCGTGAKINLLAGTNVIKSYTVVIFADANGDSLVDINDQSVIILYSTAKKTFADGEDYLAFALDLNGDMITDINDLSISTLATTGKTTINQASPY